MFESMKDAFEKQSDLLLVLFVIVILGVLFTPIPSEMLDFLLIANFSFALLILLLTFYVEKPLEFSTFPSILLIATLFRLSLNIAATRLILSDADAGQVIGAVGEHVVSGNYVIGMIVFLVLIVVQYVVVTNGAQRVAEVAARFTLDSMPGKQMSIDADMNIGIIDENEAQKKRKEIEKEGNFYGAMDGASKFVKGDAIAGIVIILIDILGGLTIGIAQKNMGWGEALHTYTLLTIGDGIVTQIPALVISTGTGIIVTRAASDAFLSKEIASQIMSYPKILVLISLGLAAMLFLPGMPALPVIIVLSIVASMGYYSYVNDKGGHEKEENIERSEDDDVYDLIRVEPIEVKVAKNVVSLVKSEDSNFLDKIVSFRKQYANEMGYIIPKVRIKDESKLNDNCYEILINNIKVSDGQLYGDKLLAINPGSVKERIKDNLTKDPTYGLEAVWISNDDYELLQTNGYTIVEPTTVLITHLSETIKKYIPELVTRSEVEFLVNKMREVESSLVDELVPNILTLSDIQKVLQSLIKEGVSIKHMSAILEILVDAGKVVKDTNILTEKVREKLSPSICQKLAKNGELNVLTLDPMLEQEIANNISKALDSLVMEPKYAEKLLIKLSTHVDNMLHSNMNPVVIITPELRRHFYEFTNKLVPQLSVLSVKEISSVVNIKSFGVISV